MYAINAIGEKIVKSAWRIPGSAVLLVFTSTSNTVAGIALRVGNPPYRWRT